MSSFSIKADGTSDRLTTHVMSAQQVTGNPYEDWVDVEVVIKAGGFSGKYKAQFLAQDIPQLHAGLEGLYNNLSGSLKFQTLEGQLEFEILGDGRGHFQTKCVAIDELGSENRLYFSLSEFDQTFIPQMLQELTEIINQVFN